MARGFNGSSQYLWRNTSVPIATVGFTVVGWYNPTNLTDIGQLFGLSGNVSSYGGLYAEFIGSVAGDPVRAAHIRDSGSSAYGVINTSFSAGTWHHAGGNFLSDVSRTAWNDGVAGTTETTNISGTITLNRVSIGGLIGLHMFNGSIAEVALYSGTLTAEEHQELAYGYAPPLVRPERLLSYWPLHGRTNNEPDIVGGHDLTAVATPTTVDHPRILYKRRARYFLPAAGGGGSTYNETITTEAVTSAEALTSALAAVGALTEAGSGAEALTSTWSGASALSEAGTASEATSGALAIAEALSDAVTAAEAVVAQLDAAGALSEAGSAAEAVSALLDAVAALSDALAAAESIAADANTYNLSLSDSVTVAEALTTALVAVGALSESGTATEATTALLSAVDTLTAAATALEALGLDGATYNMDLDEAASAAEALAAALDRYASLAEAGTADEVLGTALSAVGALAELIACAETYGTTVDALAACVEAAAASDNPTSTAILLAALAEAGNAADAIAGVIFIPVTIFDTLRRVSSLASRNVYRTSAIQRTVRGVSRIAQ